jgi:hypothetical protein
MKHLILFFAFLAYASSSFSQKVDLDKETIPVSYLRLPKDPLPDSYKFFSSIVSSRPNDLPSIGLSEKSIQKYLVVPGYSRLGTGGDFNLELTIEDFRYEGKTDIQTEKKTSKDKNGKEIETTIYKAVVKYFQPVALKIRNKEGNILLEKKWNEQVQEYKSGEYATYKDLDAFIKSGMTREISKKRQEDLLRLMADIQRQVSQKYGYTPLKDKADLWILDSEKHPDYAGFQQAYKSAQSAFGMMRSDAPVDSVILLAKPAFEYFSQQKDKYNPEEKGQKKLKYACLFNLAQMHFWTENYKDATEYANQVIANDYDPKDGKRLLEDIADVKASLEKCKKSSRHFAVVIDTVAEEKAKETVYDSDKSLRVEAYKDEQKGVTSTTVEKVGKIVYTNGKEINGSFLMDGPTRFFNDKANTRFSTESENSAIAYVPDFSKLSSFSIGEDLYRCIPFKSALNAQIGGKPSVEIMQVVYESPKVVIYLAYTGDRRSVAFPAEYAVLKVKDNEMISLSGLKFALNLDKGLLKEFADCKPVTEQIEKGGFKRNNTSMSELGKLLDSCF